MPTSKQIRDTLTASGVVLDANAPTPSESQAAALLAAHRSMTPRQQLEAVGIELDPGVPEPTADAVREIVATAQPLFLRRVRCGKVFDECGTELRNLKRRLQRILMHRLIEIDGAVRLGRGHERTPQLKAIGDRPGTIVACDGHYAQVRWQGFPTQQIHLSNLIAASSR